MIPASPKHIHFIGICGVAMSALAIACKKAGWSVTGSDAGFFPPVSDALENAGVSFYPGWHPEKMGAPDLVVVGNVAGSTNPEWQYVQKNNISYLSYPEFISKYLVKPTSIVCAGTYGKTTTTALLAWILTQAGKNPSYMFGGIATHAFDSAHLAPQGGATTSVVEGDEYKSARWDHRPKFSHYSPTHLLLTGVSWDHADVYPTEESYTQVFKELIAAIPKDGAIVACADDNRLQQSDFRLWPQITYGHSADADYQYTDVKQTSNGLQFTIIHGRELYYIESPMLGEFQAANITGAFAMARELGIQPEQIITSIKKFRGLKRRLEQRLTVPVTVFDDIAHSPAKAKHTLATVRQIAKGRIIVVFEPNTGNRKKAALASYDHAFAEADEVILPALTKLKKNLNDPDVSDKKIAEAIGKTHKHVQYIPDDDVLLSHLAQNAKAEDVIVFLGSHGFRGMIDQLVTSLRQRFQP